MSTIERHIQSVDEAIYNNIANLGDNRGILSQNILSQLRNLVEGAAALVHVGDHNAEFDYDAITASMKYVKSQGKFKLLSRFHALLEPSVSHYTFDSDGSERLMLKYYEYLHKLRSLLSDNFNLRVLTNLESFPVDLDPSLRDYHEKIAERITALASLPIDGDHSSRYYILKTRPFFVHGRIYYEVTFANPTDHVSKFDRIIAFTDQDVGDKYAATLTLRSDSIEVFGQIMPITLIRDWAVSIRPCEIDNFSRFFGPKTNVSTSAFEYRDLMGYLTSSGTTLVDLVDLSDHSYTLVKRQITNQTKKPQIFPILDQARAIIQQEKPGHVVLRYLMLHMKNVILRRQYNSQPCSRLSGLYLQWGCIPFEQMPLCTSLPGHNPRYWDLIEVFDTSSRTHELLARRLKNNIENRSILYTPASELEMFGDVARLTRRHNANLYYKHTGRSLDTDRGHVFVREYENHIVEILQEIQSYTASGVAGWQQAIDHWLGAHPVHIDDSSKRNALRSLFENSRVALIYGAAGTGKSTMVNYIANYFNNRQILFLANTHPAVDNLKRRVQTQHGEFRTVASHIQKAGGDPEYEVVVIDESSTVSNKDLLKVLEKTKFKLLVFVGDIYQIESIQFGNWFGVIRSYVPKTSVSELTTPYRTKNKNLLTLWQKVRDVDDDITETMTRGEYSTELSGQLFERQQKDEIVLCLNYDGLYGINNINRFLQSSNPENAVEWGPAIYKIGDPVVFNDSERFRPVIFNNLKGTIVNIQKRLGQIRFEIDLDRDVTEFSVHGTELEWVRDSIVSFDVFELNNSDEEDDLLNTTVPFQVAYAVSIHKAQGLEYESVKVVITDDNENSISHNIFYTALTRARKHLQVFWTPETQHTVLQKLARKTNGKDVNILASRRSLPPVV